MLDQAQREARFLYPKIPRSFPVAGETIGHCLYKFIFNIECGSWLPLRETHRRIVSVTMPENHRGKISILLLYAEGKEKV